MEKQIKNTSKKREIAGVVTSTSMNKTVKVEVGTLERHSRYSKIVKRKKVFMAHSDIELNVGDKVVIRESRPISKLVRWVVVSKK